jgi:hypothetical protein
LLLPPLNIVIFGNTLVLHYVFTARTNIPA